MHIDIIDSLERFDALKSHWDRVHSADPVASVFVSWAWLRGWFSNKERTLLVLAARPGPDADYVAFLPLAKRDTQRYGPSLTRELRMGGNPLADYNGFVILPEHEEAAIEAFAACVRDRLPWDRFDMFDVLDPRLDAFLSHFSANNFEIRREPGVPCPYIPLPDNWDVFLDEVLQNRTREIRRRLRKIDNDETLVFTEADHEDFERHVDAFLTLHQLRWGELAGEDLENFRNILHSCFENDHLWLLVLWSGEEPIAALVAFVDRRKKVLYEYNRGMDDRFKRLSPGTVLVAHSIRRAIEQGFRIYDFLRGDEGYKFDFGAVARSTDRIVLARNSLRMGIIGKVQQLRQLLEPSGRD